jgi:S-DNA-T family DNA segregation ATPase FtsK/SpoIIIE
MLWWDDWRADRVIREREENARREFRHEIRARWREACERPALQLSHVVTNNVGMGPGRYPRILAIDVPDDDDEPVTLRLSMPAGLLVEDLEDAAGELAAGLGVHRVRFEPAGDGTVRATLVEHDPHAAIVEHVEMAPGALVLGPDEVGQVLAFPLAKMGHTAIQGTTGGGKSTAVYWWLRQLVRMPAGEVRIAGLDPSGLLWRPLPPDRWRVSGLADPSRCVAVLDELVAELDRRCAAMPEDDDKLPCGAGEAFPWLVVFLEELPGLLTHLGTVSKALAEKARGAIGRLCAEGRKVGIRVVMIAQRFDANSTAGATVRNNATLRLSFAVENRAAVEFLHEGIEPALAENHTRALPGVSLVTYPGALPTRLRWPLTDFKAWHADAKAYGWPPAGEEGHELPAAA